MRRTSHKVLLSSLGAVLAVAAGLAFFVLGRREQPYERGFDTSVATPAYPEGGPVVLYDEGHRNTHTLERAYKPWAELLRADGYEVRAHGGEITTDALSAAAVFVTVCARGANDANDDPAFSGAEIDAVARWVDRGGSLLLVSDHWPYGAAMEGLAGRFGVAMGKGLVQDPEHCHPDLGDSHLIFSRDNALLGEHPILEGRGATERVARLLTFTGQSVSGPEGAGVLMELSASATERPPGPPVVDTSGGDVRVQMEYGDPIPVAGRAQGLAMEVGGGRVVVLAEAGMLRAQKTRKGYRVGMNVEGYDNRRFALNTMRWLSRAL